VTGDPKDVDGVGDCGIEALGTGVECGFCSTSAFGVAILGYWY
jgi:hypothetical protein